jgi:hypothetical protein
MPPIELYPPIEDHRRNRTGGEEEYFQRGKMGHVMTVEIAAPEIVASLNQNSYKSFQKPLEIESHALITQHATLRRYEKFDPVTEVDPDFHLQPERFRVQDALDLHPGDDLRVLRYEFLTNAPGLSSL